MFRGSTKVVFGAQVVMEVEVPGADFITQGVSLCRDVDYSVCVKSASALLLDPGPYQ
jgi:hypothetical protein